MLRSTTGVSPRTLPELMNVSDLARQVRYGLQRTTLRLDLVRAIR